MTLLTYTLAAITVAAAPQDCSRLGEIVAGKTVFTNADLDRIKACRYQTGVESQPETTQPESKKARRPDLPGAAAGSGEDETFWRSRWRALDRKVRKLRREAGELRQEAAIAPADPRKPSKGRRSPSLLVIRARDLELEARELEEEFHEIARLKGVPPGWMRPRGR